MDLRRTGLEREIADAAHAFTAARYGAQGIRDRGAGRVDPAAWGEAAGLGWFDLLVPEGHGGLGLGAVEAGAVAEAAGAGLLVGPLFGTMVAGALVRARDVPVGDVVAWAEAGPASLGGDRLTGQASLVAHAADADHLVVRVPSSDGPAVVVVDAEAPGQVVTPVPAADPTEALATVVWRSTPATVVAAGPAGTALATELDLWGRLFTASRTIGVLDRLVALAVVHATTRHQFGRPIGSFQALAHLLADLATSAEMARTATYLAQVSVASRAADASHRVRVAAVHTSRAAREVAEGALQTLGGIGFTTEHELHLYYAHALGLQAAWGDEIDHELALGRELLAGR